MLIDCHALHRYACNQTVDFLWFHFHGNSSRQYAAYLYERFGTVFAGEQIPLLRPYFESILSYAQQVPPQEHRISL